MTRTTRARALVCVENTHNAGGGTAWAEAELSEVSSAARDLGLSIHLDGARLLNASLASGLPPHAIAAYFDSVTLCLSKGLGCPVGAILAGTRDFIESAWRPKHLLGGALRQSGILAAAGLYALEHNVERLAEDHRNARRLAEGLAALPRVRLDLTRVHSNLVFFTVDGLSAPEARARLQAQGVRMSGSSGQLRAVTHLDISAADIEYAISAAERAWAAD